MVAPKPPILPPPPGMSANPAPPPSAPPLPDFTVYRNPPIVPNQAQNWNVGFDPSVLPDGARLYEDGSVTLSPEAARFIFANQSGGANTLPSAPPPLPPDMQAAMPFLSGNGANPLGNEPTPPMPYFGGQMPGQAPLPPDDPAGALMFELEQRNAPAETPRAPLSAPPSASPPPRDQWPAHLRAGEGASPSKAPIDRLRSRGKGNQNAGRGGGRKGRK